MIFMLCCVVGLGVASCGEEQGKFTGNEAHLKKVIAGGNCEKCDLTGANLTGADLTGADLTGANLTGANLTGANLTGANLTGANLTGANLWMADLTGANLTGANLTQAHLRYADLFEANLTQANLSKSDFGWANLTGANLTEANLTEVTFCQTKMPLGEDNSSKLKLELERILKSPLEEPGCQANPSGPMGGKPDGGNPLSDEDAVGGRQLSASGKYVRS